MFEDTDVAPLAEIDLERDFGPVLVRCDLNHGCQQAGIFPDRWRVDFVAEELGSDQWEP